jgi:hypothetical protein
LIIQWSFRNKTVFYFFPDDYKLLLSRHWMKQSKISLY